MSAGSGGLNAVSRETRARLDTYLALLGRWNPAINLVAKSTMAGAEQRHMADSAQLIAYIPDPSARLVDLGSGGGFPGLVLAILGCSDVHLIESDARKAAFLREVSRETAAPVTVHNARAEAVAPLGAAAVTARAFAPLPRLLPLAHRHLAPSGRCVLLKGARAEDELTAARQSWTMTVQQVPSKTDPGGQVLILSSLARR